jgi:TfoX/Sxy family transcriptional regulator of competence genes
MNAMKTKWQKSPQELVDLMTERMKGVRCDYRKMFGYLAYFIDGNMFTGLFEEQVFLRLSNKDQSKFTEEYSNAKHFEPVEGRKMKNYIVVPKEVYSSEEAFKHWLARSLEYTRTLPKRAK